MNRYWLLTWTTYGSWLPGDERGFVSNVDRGDGKGHRVNKFGTEPVSKMRGLQQMAREKLVGPSVLLQQLHAESLLEQFHETVRHRAWEMCAAAIMRNHVHVILGVCGDPEPATLLQALKSYGSRRLNHRFATPQSGTWWTESGSRHKLPDEVAVRAAVSYVQNQEFPLIVWIHPRWAGTE